MSIIRETISIPPYPATIDWAGVKRVIDKIISTINGGLSNDNLSASSGIANYKIEYGDFLEDHGQRHETTGEDQLEKGAVAGSMIQAASINPWHIGVGAVLPEHIGYDDTLGDLIYIDPAPLHGTDGTRITKPSGYEKWQILFAGFHFVSSQSDASINHVDVSFTKEGEYFIIDASATREDHSESCSCTVYYYRLGWN